MKIYFTDFFDVSPETLEEYGAFNMSLVNDLPLFIDPFLLFESDKPEYKSLHEGIIRYVRFLREESLRRGGAMPPGLLDHWYKFKEVHQNWLGYSKVGNRGSALGKKFAHALHGNLQTLFPTFGEQKDSITAGSHLEKVCLVSEGVGRDNISDFTTNLIKEYLLEYTQTFAVAHIRPAFRRRVPVRHVRFDYERQRWMSGTYDLPYYRGDYVLLTPKDILTKEEMWINRDDLYEQFQDITDALPNHELRALVNEYFRSELPDNANKGDTKDTIRKVIRRFPDLLDYYIKDKEESGDEAVASSIEQVSETETLFIEQVRDFVEDRLAGTEFYERKGDTLDGARARSLFLKSVIETQDGYQVFYLGDEPISTEDDLKVLYRLVWYATTPQDAFQRAATSSQALGSRDQKSPVEFKRAGNPQLRKSLEEHAEVRKQPDKGEMTVKVIICFSSIEIEKVGAYLRELSLQDDQDVILIDARIKEKGAPISVLHTPREQAAQARRPRAVILTALPVEYSAVRAYLHDPQDDEHPQGTVYERGVFQTRTQTWDIWIGEIGAGNNSAAMEAERAIQHVGPNVILFVGVAGGVKDVRVGDVIAATKVYGYESGKAGPSSKASTGFKTRPDVGQSSYSMEQRARAEAKKADWLQRLQAPPAAESDPAPVVFVGPIAAGGRVVASVRSETARFLKEHYGDALAVEMEGRGFLEAARANQQVKALIVRGISDLLSGKRQADKSGSQALAARHASAFAFHVLAKIEIRPLS